MVLLPRGEFTFSCKVVMGNVMENIVLLSLLKLCGTVGVVS